MVTNGVLHASPYPIQSTGLPVQKIKHGLPPIVNFFHPQTQAEIEKMVRALVNQGKRYKSFKGITFQLYRDGAAWWGDIKSGYNDYVIEAFEKDTGLKIPCDRKDPLRGKAYYEWIRANAYDRWVTWRCEKMKDYPCKTSALEFVKVRALEKSGRHWFYAVNTESEQAQVSFQSPPCCTDTLSLAPKCEGYGRPGRYGGNLRTRARHIVWRGRICL